MTVNIYKTACSGTADVSGSATSFALTAAGIQLPANTVALNSATNLYVEAVDQAGNKSNCASLSYTHDDTLPAAPSTISSTPATPSSATSLALKGNCELNSTVNVYTSFCRGASAGSGACAAFDGGAGIAVTASANDVTRFYIDQVDQAGNQSGSCTYFDFRHDNVPPTFVGEGTAKAVPNTNDKIEVTWDAASDPGGSGVGRYELCWSDDAGVCMGAFAANTTVSASATSYVIEDAGLAEDRRYYVTLRAYDNADGGTLNPYELTARTGGVGAVLQVATGEYHTCALMADGTVRCWGKNNWFQLGTDAGAESRIPVAVPGIVNATRVSAGGYHTCVVLADGTAKCWGINSDGALGTGTSNSPLQPTVVAGGVDRFVDISAGYGHTCALRVNGEVRCWGYGYFGQIGIGSSGYQNLLPVTPVGLGAGVIAIGSGADHSCAVLADGKAKCWGSNYYGQLGDGTNTTRYSPVDVDGSVYKAIAGGGSHTCAIKGNGKVECWGRNAYGQLGDNSITERWNPVTVKTIGGSSFGGVTSLSVGINHSCAVQKGLTYCWGINNFGQMEEPTQSPNYRTGAKLIDAGAASDDTIQVAASTGDHVCRLRANGRVYCWGNNSYGQIGSGSTSSDVRVSEEAQPLLGVVSAKAFATSYRHSCALMSNGKIKCWGGDEQGQLAQNPGDAGSLTPITVDAGTAVAIAAGHGHTCLVQADGKAKCWGNGAAGRLGDDTNTSREWVGPEVVGLDNAVQITAGSSHTCVVKGDGTASCWGDNWNRQLGAGLTSDYEDTAQAVLNLADVKMIATGAEHSCALVTDGGVFCWGKGYWGQVGDGNTSTGDRATAVPVVGLGGAARAISLGSGFSCALTVGGSPKCWGSNSSYQLGNGTAVDQYAAVDVSGIASGEVRSIFSGYSHSCAVHYDGTLKCWGYGANGGLGNGSWASSYSATPASSSLTNVWGDLASSQSNHSCVRLADGRAKCWGMNDRGQLGDGTSVNTNTPSFVVDFP